MSIQVITVIKQIIEKSYALSISPCVCHLIKLCC